MDDVKTYTIDGVEIQQGCVTIGQVRRLTALLKDVKFDGLSPAGIVNRLIDSDLLDRVLCIILKGPDDFILQVDAMPFKLLVEIVQDFLACNDIGGLLSTIFSTMSELTSVMPAQE